MFNSFNNSGRIILFIFVIMIMANPLIYSQTATQMRFSSIPASPVTGKPFTLVVNATDNSGNTDITFNQQISLSLRRGQGRLSSAGSLSKPAVNGTVTWNDLIYNAADTFSINAHTSSLPDTVTPLIYCSNSSFIGSDTTYIVYPFSTSFGFVRSASLYKSSEIASFNRIAELGWYVNTISVADIPVKIYLKTTTDTVLPQDNWPDYLAGATLVYSDTVRFDQTGWRDIILDNFFDYQSGNLMVLCETNIGNSGSPFEAQFRYSTTSLMHASVYSNGNPPLTDSVFVNYFRPNIHVVFETQKTFRSVIASQIEDTVKTGSNNNPVIMLNVNVLGNSGTLFFDSLMVHVRNTRNNDLKDNGIKLYVTGTPVFNKNYRASGGLSPDNNGNVMFIPSQPLNIPAHNAYFWVTYDVSCTPVIFDSLDVTINAHDLFIGGGRYISSAVDPEGMCIIDTLIIIPNAETLRHIICAGSPAIGSVTANPEGGNDIYTYKWEKDGTYISDHKTLFGLYAGMYRVTVFDSSCTNLNAVDTAIVNPAPWVTVLPADTFACSGSDFLLHSSYSGAFPSHVPCMNNCDTTASPCIPSFADGSASDFIRRVKIGTNENISTFPHTGQYQDFTGNIFATFYEGMQDTIYVEADNSSNVTEYVVVYIDWNRNGSFDMPEDSFFVGFSTYQGSHTFAQAIQAPATVSPGKTRMRVTVRWNGPATPCDNTGYGEAEDYTVDLWNHGTPDYQWVEPSGNILHAWDISKPNIQTADAGNYTFVLRYGTCTDSTPVHLEIRPMPVTDFPSNTQICYLAPPFVINTGIGFPAGGTGLYSGNGVSNNTFDPTTAGYGSHIINFIYTLNGCAASDTALFIVGCEGIEEPASVKISCYPNPATDRLIIDLKEKGNYLLKLSDITGKLVYSNDICSYSGIYTINTTGFSKGIHTLQIVTAEKTYTVKVILQ